MFEKNLKRIMSEKGISGAALARITGFSKAAVSQYINGINTPSKGRMEAIADALGVTVEDLTTGSALQVALSEKTTLTCKEAATLLHKHESYIRQGLKEGRPGFEFGSAVKTSGKWSYCIYAKKFTEITGIPVNI